jgi:histidinol-phosphate aminotransferase
MKAAAFLLARDGEIRTQIAKIREGRDWLIENMRKIERLHVYPSEGNIILFRVQGDGDGLFKGLIQDGVLIRNLSRPGRLYNCFRVSVGTDEENGIFIESLRRRLAGA